MSFHACAALVEKADPLRFRVAMAAPVAARQILFPLYAFNVEVARAPWVTQEAMIAEMRLQWWRDALEEIGGDSPVRKHEVVDALAEVIDAEGAASLDGLIAARRWDVYTDAFEDSAHFESYIDATSGNLMWTAARLLGQADEDVVRDFAYGAGIANFLQAIPALEAQNRKPLVDGRPDAVRALAQDGLDRMARAKAGRNKVSRNAAPALVAGYHAKGILKLAIAQPDRVADDRLALNPARDSWRFANCSLRGWWR